MKSSNMWALHRPISVHIGNAEHADNWIKKIQLDAIKEGMRRAAEFLDNNYDMPIYNGHSLKAYAILSASEQLTENDL